jgi:integrase
MPTEYRKERKKWGYRFSLHGRLWKKYVWDTEREARDAEAAHRTELLNNPPVRTDSLSNVAALYLIDSAEQGRSKWRIDALRYNLNAFILPFFKPETPISAISETDVEGFIKHHKRRGRKNLTIWHYIKDLRSLFYWAMEKDHKFVRVNPVVDADLDLIKRRKAIKPPLNPKQFERAFAILDEYERAWWRTMECLGLRMDEGNRLLRTDPDFDTGMMHIPGTKTENSECYLPMSPALQSELKSYLESRTDESPFLFPGRSAQTKGKKIYSRRRLFEKIRRVTAFKVYMEKNPTSTPMKAWKELKRNDYPGGVKLTTKELRDYFATQVSAQVSDPTTVKNLMRHTSLNTTSLYTRTVIERMKEAVQNLGLKATDTRPLGTGLGGRSGGISLRKNAQRDILVKLIARRLREREVAKSGEYRKEKMYDGSMKSGGRSRNRTYDLAHVRRAL